MQYTASSTNLRHPSPNHRVERVYGEIKTIQHTRSGATAKSAVTRIAVSCPYCDDIHLHHPTRSRLTQPLTYVHSSEDTTTHDYLNRHVTHRMFDRTVNWETDRVSLCKRGTYHIVGWTDPSYISLPVQPMRCKKDADGDVVSEWTCHDRHMRTQIVPDASVLEELRRPHIGRGVMVR